MINFIQLGNIIANLVAFVPIKLEIITQITLESYIITKTPLLNLIIIKSAQTFFLSTIFHLTAQNTCLQMRRVTCTLF